MRFLSAACSRLASIDGLRVEKDAPLSRYTRFGLGGPASLLVDAGNENALRDAILYLKSETIPFVVIGGGSNLVVADAGYPGVIIRYTANSISRSGELTFRLSSIFQFTTALQASTQ
jgi:UDP-N-acetylmuramate dehydrogenase